MEFKFVDQNSNYYRQGVALRIKLFFNGIHNAQMLIDDTHENSSFHIVCVSKDDNVIGTGRLKIEKETGIISQMAIHTDYQRKGIGKEILNLLIEKCAEFNINKVELSARITALAFYKKLDFMEQGVQYPSNKTGIIHQKMTRTLISPL